MMSNPRPAALSSAARELISKTKKKFGPNLGWGGVGYVSPTSSRCILVNTKDDFREKVISIKRTFDIMIFDKTYHSIEHTFNKTYFQQKVFYKMIFDKTFYYDIIIYQFYCYHLACGSHRV